MPTVVLPPKEPFDQPDEESQKKSRERFSILAKAYNDGIEAGGVEEGLRRLYAKLDELAPRPYKVTDPVLRHFAAGS